MSVVQRHAVGDATAAVVPDHGVGCIAGALRVSDAPRGASEAGFADVSIEFTHAVGDGVHAAIVRAVKPAAH